MMVVLFTAMFPHELKVRNREKIHLEIKSTYFGK